MTSTPKPGELPLSRMLNSQLAPLLEQRAGRSSWAEQAASKPETTLGRFPFQSDGGRQGMGGVRQARVCPLLDTHRCCEVSTLKVFGGGPDHAPRGLSSLTELPIPLGGNKEPTAPARRSTRGRKTGSNEILENRGALYGRSCLVGPRRLPLYCPRTGIHRQGYEWN